ncbi:BTAD domain-containing putative transcriptional regulator [Spongiactinospora sp. TRM90649]|uniref:BTAD domain-containing putative transcriptional regulator n=1 Tax=Spongiactinospora sp. TRM90649 TaxID=3031114 RepID=UPI0023F84F7C|nr:BTAD domain-containing putative transcriptional regulator [Spongiactinospora sp. TRM90649]MDF5758553.1 BTAD domain-containing putative transcriptional regulator [Spongiactinospora sp. TRM90649]
MRFGILGATRAWRDGGGEVPLGGPARRALLALLLVEPGVTVTVDRLIEALYGEAGGSAHALQSQVSRLRRILGPEAPIERVATGYRITAGPDDVDAGRFERLAVAGGRALRDGDPHQAGSLLRAALELWRGPALADVADLAGAEAARARGERLEERRLAVLEDRAEADLLLGESRTVAAELRELVTAHPLRERAHGLLMRALAADGRQAEALTAFERARRHLADELGADPSPELAAIHTGLLRGDPGPAAPVATGPPAQLTTFVGREGDVAGITTLLRTARLVTLHGPGGVGKTRLSVEAATTVDAVSHSDEVFFVRLAPVRDGADVAQAVAGALGLRETGLSAAPALPPAARLTAALTDRSTLLVLDNCEHVIDGVAALAEHLLAACPRLRVLATSREPLGLPGEHLWQVRPLADGDAARMFADRAAAARRGFTLDDVSAADVARICAALDGLPLAIELAAARLRTHDLADLAARLAGPFRLPAWASRTTEVRHQTLRAVVAWSWDLLPAAEQEIARRFTVFAGGATAESVAQVCGGTTREAVDTVLDSLTDKSLIEFSGGRYRMLETIRAYGAERLEAAGEADAVRRAHAAHLLGLARTADSAVRGVGQLDWLRVFGDEHENLRAALRRAIAVRDLPTAFGLLGAMCVFLWIRGLRPSVEAQAVALLDLVEPGRVPSEVEADYPLCVLLAGDGGARHHEAAQRAATSAHRHSAAAFLWLLTGASTMEPEAALALVAETRASPDPWERAGSDLIWGYSEYGGGDHAQAEARYAAAVDGFRTLGDRWGTALALDAQAWLAGARGDHERAIELTDQALRLTEQLGATEDIADLLCNRGDYRQSTDRAAARADYEQASALARHSGSPTYQAAALRGLADVAYLDGDLETAERHYLDALDRFDLQAIRSVGSLARALVGLGRIAERRGDLAAAREHHRQAAEATVARGAVPECARPMEALAGIALGEGDPETAAVLLGAARTLRGRAAPPDSDGPELAERARQALGAAPYDEAHARGAALSRAEALFRVGVPSEIILASPLHTMFGESPVSER